jgi:hypothetical protein
MLGAPQRKFSQITSHFLLNYLVLLTQLFRYSLHSHCASLPQVSLVMPSQTFAEYENSAPELVTQVPISQSKATGSSDVKGRLESHSEQPYSGQPYSGKPYSGQPYSGQPNSSVGRANKRKVLGLAPWVAFTFIFIALVIVVGVIVGAVLGTKHKNHTGKLSYDATEHHLEFANLYLSHCA